MSGESDSPKSRFRFGLGPGLLVTAAFIGPGTVITASKAGTQFGCELLWTVLFASVGTIMLQSLAARLGIVTGSGLSEAIRDTLAGSRWLRPIIGLVIVAIGLGNAAYQTGNLMGAVVGISSIFGGHAEIWAAALAIATIGVIASGRDRMLQRVLVSLVVMLSLAFLVTAATGLPSFGRVASGLLVPRVTPDSLTLVLGMIGTTIVPYNLFLHASRSASTWKGAAPGDALAQARWDTVISISLGGFVTAAILVTASGAFFDRGVSWESPAQIASQLRPTLGPVSGHAFAVGLFCAGLTSAVTAPLATAYAICGCLGWSSNPSSTPFRAIAILVVVVGATAAIFLEGSPASTILTAQVANGMLLPIVATLMLVVVQKSTKAPQEGLSMIGICGAWIVVGLVSMLGIWRVIAAVFF